MNDQRLMTLARMAREVEELERAAAAPPQPLPMAAPGRVGTRSSVLGPLAALAACAAVAAGIVMWPSGGAGPITLEPSKASTQNRVIVPLVPQVLPPTESSIVLAIVEDPDGGVQCVSWMAHDPTSAAYHGLAPADLARAICKADCVAGPHWLLAARVSGPVSMMPSRDEEVQALAACIIEEHGERCDGGPTVLAPGPGSAQCIPAGVRVVVERRSLAMP